MAAAGATPEGASAIAVNKRRKAGKSRRHRAKSRPRPTSYRALGDFENLDVGNECRSAAIRPLTAGLAADGIGAAAASSWRLHQFAKAYRLRQNILVWAGHGRRRAVGSCDRGSTCTNNWEMPGCVARPA